MKRVTGLGGVFFKAKDPNKLAVWYREHLGIPVGNGSANFAWRTMPDPKRRGLTVWAIFPKRSDYFGPAANSFMLNYRVKDLDRLLKQLRKEGVAVDDKVEATDYGKFGWATDPEGNRIEFWEPPESDEVPKPNLPSE